MKAVKQLRFRALVAGVTVLVSASAQADLVLEDEVGSVAPAQQQVIAVPVQQVVQQQPTQVLMQAPMAQPVAVEDEVTRAELLRRQRMRAELKNEDILSERLEALRLREEQQRTQQLITEATLQQHQPVELVPVQQVPVQTVTPVVVQPVGSIAADVQVEHAPKKSKFTIAPRGGMAAFVGTNGFQTRPRFSLGAAVGTEVSPFVGIELGYTYSEIGVALASANPWVNYMQQYASMYSYNPTATTYTYHQHLIDAVAKIYVLGNKFKIRPYIVAGLGYTRSSINYDRSILAMLQQMGMGYGGIESYKVNSFVGEMGAGADVVLGKGISLGAQFKYNHVLAARENAPLYGPAFGGYSAMSPYSAYGAQGGAGGQDASKAIAGGSLARTGFFQVMGNVTFSF